MLLFVSRTLLVSAIGLTTSSLQLFASTYLLISQVWCIRCPVFCELVQLVELDLTPEVVVVVCFVYRDPGTNQTFTLLYY